ncbi:uncharacterized protein TRAVEDRAFT_53425 [Trametes versicolor FP-101664 SS1]|uniref:uncharacterized protein n=1 Tax=Trametes versicolor (strain FP-101664) TaxID=717944 RepID=UPI0004621452|nr:uncharacterized protein TRAVEDRAFT_53425 [Trametes versicolor FP-101664 SS1]EIW53008.1 hypothetical protein TRAVEDRAFT_53425 [Trametes versicolor FP-101664 SS1]
MADAKVAPNKLAMSRALGAAFLNHQVEQLEKTVHTGGNWRGRRSPETWRGETKRTVSGPGPKIMRRRNDDGEDRPRAESETAVREDRRSEERKVQKDADVVVVDATVLVHGLYHIKKWCREGREEVIIIPLEALNTLDLLKKGTTVLAQRARAASRILEAQVGTNPRIRVQQDDAFVPWDNIPFDDQPGSALNTAPEWVRRTICCARWEVDHAGEAQKDGKPSKLRVVLAVVSPPADGPAESANSAPVSASPVPLPAPQPNKYESRLSGALVGRWASKAGVEVLEVTSAPPSSQSGNAPTDAPLKARRSAEGRRSAEDERAKRAQSHGQSGRGRRNSRGTTPGARPPPATGTGLVERPPAVMAMMEMVAQPSRVVRVLARGEKLDP